MVYPGSYNQAKSDFGIPHFLVVYNYHIDNRSIADNKSLFRLTLRPIKFEMSDFGRTQWLFAVYVSACVFMR